MTDLTSILNTIQIEETAYRDGVGKSVYTRIGETVNHFIDNIPQSIGNLQWSVLTEEQFQARRGTNWILCDGRDVTGSDYDTLTGNTTIPDGRGKFTRGLDNGAGIDIGRVMATEQTDQNDDHTHRNGYRSAENGSLTAGGRWNVRSTSIFGLQFDNNLNNSVSNTVGTSGNEGEDFRPINTCLNLFVKVNFES